MSMYIKPLSSSLPSPSFFLYNQEMLVQLPLILIFGMAAFCGGIGILVLEMKPREALTGWLPFCAIHHRWQQHHSKELSKHDCFGDLFYSKHSCKPLIILHLLRMFLACLLPYIKPRFQGTDMNWSCFARQTTAWSHRGVVLATAGDIPEVRYRTNKSS